MLSSIYIYIYIVVLLQLLSSCIVIPSTCDVFDCHLPCNTYYGFTYCRKILMCSDCDVLVFVSDGTASYDSKDELPMKIFSPFAGFLCVVAAFLLILLFVGVVSETGQHHLTQEKMHLLIAIVLTCFNMLFCVSELRFFCFCRLVCYKMQHAVIM